MPTERNQETEDEPEHQHLFIKGHQVQTAERGKREYKNKDHCLRKYRPFQAYHDNKHHPEHDLYPGVQIMKETPP